MAGTAWAELVTNQFFIRRETPPQRRCDEIAQSISGASEVSPVESPGSMSYTVICRGCPGPDENMIVSLRETEAKLDAHMLQLAVGIHGQLVPEATRHGPVQGAEPPLFIYTMPYLRGTSYLDTLPCQVDMYPTEEARQTVFVQHLARYFARCWSNPQVAEPETQVENPYNLLNRLVRLAEKAPPSTLLKARLPDLVQALLVMLDREYPKALTHGDLSVTNILIDESTFEITGIVDWSLAAVMPFGLDLDILFLATGFMTHDGWHNYECKPLLMEAFWVEFWNSTGIDDATKRERVRSVAMAAAQIGAILRLAFKRNADGSPSHEILMTDAGMAQIEAWLRGVETEVLPRDSLSMVDLFDQNVF